MGNKFVPIGIIIIAVLALVVVKPMAVDTRKTNAQINAYSERSEALGMKIAKLREFQPKLAEYSATINDLRTAMPAAQQIPEVLVMVEAIAKNTGLNISGFDIQPSSGGSEVGVGMSASGTYDNLASFTSKLENNVRPIKIKSMAVTSGQGDASQIAVSVSFGILYQGKVDQQVADQLN